MDIHSVSARDEKSNDGMNPTAIRKLLYIAEQFNDFSSESNQKVIDNMVHHTDESMKNLNHAIEIFSNLKKHKKDLLDL